MISYASTHRGYKKIGPPKWLAIFMEFVNVTVNDEYWLSLQPGSQLVKLLALATPREFHGILECKMATICLSGLLGSHGERSYSPMLAKTSTLSYLETNIYTNVYTCIYSCLWAYIFVTYVLITFHFRLYRCILAIWRCFQPTEQLVSRAGHSVTLWFRCPRKTLLLDLLSQGISRWWFQKIQMFTLTWEHDPIWLLQYFSNGLVQPPTIDIYAPSWEYKGPTSMPPRPGNEALMASWLIT